jgi:hypothetical protein
MVSTKINNQKEVIERAKWVLLVQDVVLLFDCCHIPGAPSGSLYVASLPAIVIAPSANLSAPVLRVSVVWSDAVSFLISVVLGRIFVASGYWALFNIACLRCRPLASKHYPTFIKKSVQNDEHSCRQYAVRPRPCDDWDTANDLRLQPSYGVESRGLPGLR